MKIIKISLAIAVVGIISFFVIKSLEGSPPPPPPSPTPSNSFASDIEQEINNFSFRHDNKFYKDEYNEIKYHIDEHYKSQHLGATEFENDQWKEILSKKLYTVYTGKFIKQSFNVFNKTEWKIQDLAFIKSESKTLRKSEFIERDSPVDNSFSKIQLILSNYDIINAFISSCKGYSFTDYGIDERFPNTILKNKISQAESYKSENYVKNCIRLINELNKIHNILLNKNYNYLLNKINKLSGNYKELKSFNEYTNFIDKPLRTQIDEFKNISIHYTYPYQSQYNELIDNLKIDNQKAYDYLSKNKF